MNTTKIDTAAASSGVLADLGAVIERWQGLHDNAEGFSDEPESDRAEFASVLTHLRAYRALLASAAPAPASDGERTTHDLIRQCGGIVHSDGNIFFTSRYQFEHAASLLCGTATVAAAPIQQAAPAAVVPAEKIAPVQGYAPGIPWSIHLEAYEAYSKKWAPQPALIDLEGRNCRGGFSVDELNEFVPGWRERVSEIGRLRAEIARLTDERIDADKLQREIKNLPTRGPRGTIHTSDYLAGHRDARHAAAELVSAALAHGVDAPAEPGSAGKSLAVIEHHLDALFRENAIPMSDRNARLYDAIRSAALGVPASPNDQERGGA